MPLSAASHERRQKLADGAVQHHVGQVVEGSRLAVEDDQFGPRAFGGGHDVRDRKDREGAAGEIRAGLLRGAAQRA
ncbi:MAG TPA: hypothetical protein VF331_06715 [Polyangiales bacterium]